MLPRRLSNVPFWQTVIWIVTLPVLWYSLNTATELRVDVGQWGDQVILSGVHGREVNPLEDYRWTEATATITFPHLSDRYHLLQIRAHGWRPEGIPQPRVQSIIAGRTWGIFEVQSHPRTYTILLPHNAMRGLVLETSLVSETFTPQDPVRIVGIAIDRIALQALDTSSSIVTWQLIGQALLLGMALALIALLALPFVATLVCSALASATLIGLNTIEPLWVSVGLIHWLILIALLLGATWMLAPRLAHALEQMFDTPSQPSLPSKPWITHAQARIAWALLVAALLIRLAGAVHPLFDARDLHVHTRWLTTVSTGQLYFYSTPAEFQNRQTFNPPAAYIILLPLYLALGDMRLTVQAGIAALDALIALFLLLIAREFGLPARAGLFAMALYVALPIAMTIMWWGFAANAVAQVWWVLLLWLLLRLTRAPNRSLFALFTFVAILCLTTHIGALVILVAFLGIVALFGWRTLPRHSRRAMLAGVFLAGAFVAPVYVAVAAAPLVDASRSPLSLDLGASMVEGLALWAERVNLVQRAWVLGFIPPILILALIGLLLLFEAPRRHPLQRTIVLSTLIVCIIFFLSYVFLELLTRYIYFATPIVCLAAGATLARLSARPGGRWMTYSLVCLVIWSGVMLWFGGVLLRIKPSLVPLTQ